MKPICCTEIQSLVNAGVPILCIDVRESFRHQTMDAGGLKVQYNQINRHTKLLRQFVTHIAVVCCLRPKGSKRTQIAAASLKSIGFTDVRELEGGLYNGWIQKVGRQIKMPAPAQSAAT